MFPGLAITLTKHFAFAYCDCKHTVQVLIVRGYCHFKRNIQNLYSLGAVTYYTSVTLLQFSV